MDARQLRYFLAVVDHGGIARAAEALRVAQPSLSQAIGGFERELGVALFHRIGRRVVLSETGTALIGPARVVVRDLERAEQSVASRRALDEGRLDIVSMPSPGLEPLTSILAGFTRAHPGMALNIAAAFTPDDVLEAVRSGESEVGILGSGRPVSVAGLSSIVLERQPFVLVSPGDSGDPGSAEEGTIESSQLTGMRLIVSQRGSSARSVVDRMIEDGVDVRIVAEVAHRTSILPMVLAGIGHAVLPSAWTTIARSAGARVRTIAPETHLHVVAISRRSDLTPGAAAFMDMAAATQR
jgi:DNA-binding transcriptional LysR family regulator